MSGGSDGRPVEVLHSKRGQSLVRYETPDGTWAYAVMDADGRFVFQGTKAEAKKFYGTWRSDSR